MTTGADNLNWLLSSFTERVNGVRHAVVVSADGLLIAVSGGLDRATADKLAAVTSGLSSLTEGAARSFSAGHVRQVIVEMDHGFLFVASISDGACLSVVTTTTADLGVVGYEMTALAQRAGAVLTPQLVADLQAALPR